MNENELKECIEVNQLAKRTGMSGAYWKNRAKDGEVKGVRLGNRVVIEVKSVNAFLEANRIRRLAA